MSTEPSLESPVTRREVRAAVIGIGNADRGDDGVGRVVVRALRGRVDREVVLIECEGDLLSLVHMLEPFDKVIIVDALNDGEAAGAVRRFEADTARLPTARWSSTHALGLGETIELARAVGTLPETVTVYGVAGRRFAVGAALSEQAEEGARHAAKLILQDLENWRSGSPTAGGQ